MKRKTCFLFLWLAILLLAAWPAQPVFGLAKGQTVSWEARFSPDGGVQAKIIELIENTEESLDIAIYSLTAPKIGEAIRRARGRGVAVRIIADAEQAGQSGSLVPDLLAAGFPVKTITGLARGKEKDKFGLMHNKFAVFDGRSLVTGSYNWTNSAEYYNYENALFLDQPEITARYQAYFDRLWYSLLEKKGQQEKP